MSKDYKNPRGRRTVGVSGMSGFLAGLAIGLGVALAVFLYDRRPVPPTAEQPAPAAEAPEPDVAESSEDAGQRFDFYEMLPKFEVVVPEREKPEAAGARAAPIAKPGAYVLQVGSYCNFADADRMRAQLALQNIESKIQRVSVDSDTWHRVRIGPVSDLAELNRLRDRLSRSKIEALVIRVGE
jgi:cell division protein FtsN